MEQAQAISGFFRTRSEGEAAQRDLFINGFSRDDVSFVAGDTAPHDIPAIGPLFGTGAESEAVSDAFVGGLVGLAAGMAVFMIPGIGQAVAAGPLAGAIGGMALGSAAGGIIGWLRDQGVSQEEAEFYAEGVRRGGALVTVHQVEGDSARLARAILTRSGAMEIERLVEEAAPKAG